MICPCFSQHEMTMNSVILHLSYGLQFHKTDPYQPYTDPANKYKAWHLLPLRGVQKLLQTHQFPSWTWTMQFIVNQTHVGTPSCYSCTKCVLKIVSNKNIIYFCLSNVCYKLQCLNSAFSRNQWAWTKSRRLVIL